MTVDLAAVPLVLLLVLLPVFSWLLLRATWTQPTLRQQAKERRRLNEEWLAVRAARRQRGRCPRCASPLTERDWHFAPTLAEGPADDDLHGELGDIDPASSPTSLSSVTRTGPTKAGTVGRPSGSLQESQKGEKANSEPVWSSVAHEQGWSQYNLDLVQILPITIYLADEAAHEQVEAAVEDLLAVAGGHIEHRDDPVFGSWFRRMRARTGQAVHSPLAREAAVLAAHAAESRLVHAQDASVTATMLQNLGPVLAALQPTKDAVIRAGALLIVKADWIVAVHQLTAAQQLQLDHQPQLVQSPHDILSALERRTGSATPSAEAVDGIRGSTLAPGCLNGNPTPLRITSSNGEGSTPLNAADHEAFPEASAGT